MPARQPSAPWIDLLLVVGLALVLRLLFCVAVYPHVADRFAAGDGYDVIALNVVHGKGYVLDGLPAAAARLPVYPLLLALGFAAFGGVSWPWQLGQCICGAATCAVVLTMARRYASRAAALVASGFCAIHPTLILYAARPFTETVYIFLLVLLVRVLSAAPERVAAGGALLGLQLLTKSTAGLHVVAFLPALARRQWSALLRAGVVMLALLAPWLAWNLWTSGAPNLFSATGGIALYHGIYISRHVAWTRPAGDFNRDAEIELWHDLEGRGVPRSADIVQRNRVAGQLARAWVTQHAGEALRLWARNLVLTWYLGRDRLSMLVHAILHCCLLAAAAVGAPRLWRWRPESHAMVSIAVLLIAAYTVFHAAVQPAVRYILPAVPLAALLAAGVFVGPMPPPDTGDRAARGK